MQRCHRTTNRLRVADRRIAVLYNLPMRIKHKGLRAIYRQGSKAGVLAHLAPRLRRILLALDAAK